MALLALMGEAATAQVTFTESFTGTTAAGWIFGGSDTSTAPYLTANSGDAIGDGWLRLTQNVGNQATYALLDTEIFSVGASIQIEMEYAFYNGTGADGITFFLVDGSIDSSTFQPGAYGGSMGYAQKIQAEGGEADLAGMPGGYLGFAFDNWGNYSNGYEGRNGGITDDSTLYPNRIAVRGPESSDYEFIAASADLSTLPGGGQMDFPDSTTRPDQSGADYRSFRLTLDANNQLTVEMKFGKSSDYITAFTADLSDYDRPETFKIGFTGATGGANEIHEVRNILVTSYAAHDPGIHNYEWDNGGGGDKLVSLGSNWVGDNAPGTHGDLLFRNASPNTSQTVNFGEAYTARSLNFESTRDHSLGGGTITLGDGIVGNDAAINVKQSGSAIVHHRIANNLVLAETTRITNIGNAVLCLSGVYATGTHSTHLAGDGSINFNGQITGSGAIIKGGTGITTLNGDNSDWSGALTINQGVVAITHGNALGATDTSSGTTVNSGGSLFLRGGTASSPLVTAEPLRLAGDGVTLRGGGRSGALHADGGPGGSFTVSGAITLTGDAAIGGRAGSTLNITGAIGQTSGGAKSLTKVGEGLVVFGANNTYTGATIIEGGALRVNNTNRIDGSNITLNGGVLEIASGFGPFTRGLGSGGNNVRWTGDGGFSAFGADATVNIGNGTNLTWGTAGFVGAGDALLLSSDYATHTVTFQNNIALAGSASTLREIRVANGSAAADGVLSGVLSGASGINKTGAGTLSLTGANTYGSVNYGNTVVSGGALRVTTTSLPGGYDTNTNGNGTNNYGAVVLNGGVLELASNTTFTRTLTTSFNNASSREEGIYWTGDGGFSAYDATAGQTRTVTLGGGNLTWGGAGFVGVNNKLLFGSDGANGTVNFTNNIALGGSGTRTIQVTAGTANVASGRLSGVVSGTAALSVTGNGRLDLAGANSFTGDLTIIGAEVRLGGSGGTLTGGTGGNGVSSIIVRQGGVFSIDHGSSSSNTINRVRDNAAVSLQGGTLNLYGRTGNNDTAETIGTVTLSGGANTINVARGSSNGSAQLIIGGLTRIAGATVNFTASAGTLGGSGDNGSRIVGSNGNTLSNTNGILGGWATVDDNWAYEINNSRGIGAYNDYETSTNVANWAANENISISGNATNNADRTVNSFRLNGASAGRTLDLDNNGTNRTFTITSGGILSVGSNTNTIRADNAGSILRAGTGSADLIVHTQGTDNTLVVDAQIANHGGTAKGLTKAGAGTLTFSGTTANTYTGVTTVNDGTLVLNKSANTTAVGGDLVIGDGRGQDRVVIQANEQIDDSASVTLRGGEVGNSANVASLVFDDSAGAITETFASLHIEGNSVLDFSGGTPCSPTYLILGSLTTAEGSLLTIKNWIEFTDYLLVEKAAFDAIPAENRPRIVFEGYTGTWSIAVYDGTYYQITPVPEPAAYGALALGGLVTFVLTRRRRRGVA